MFNLKFSDELIGKDLTTLQLFLLLDYVEINLGKIFNSLTDEAPYKILNYNPIKSPMNCKRKCQFGFPTKFYEYNAFQKHPSKGCQKKKHERGKSVIPIRTSSRPKSIFLRICAKNF